MTKRQKKLVDQYKNSELSCLDDCYCDCSETKQYGEAYILEDMDRRDGDDYRILSFGKRAFVGAYKLERPDEDGWGIILWLRVFHMCAFPIRIEDIPLERIR